GNGRIKFSCCYDELKIATPDDAHPGVESRRWSHAVPSPRWCTGPRGPSEAEVTPRVVRRSSCSALPQDRPAGERGQLHSAAASDAWLVASSRASLVAVEPSVAVAS